LPAWWREINIEPGKIHNGLSQKKNIHSFCFAVIFAGKKV
jgi:hypothetical protein